MFPPLCPVSERLAKVLASFNVVLDGAAYSTLRDLLMSPTPQSTFPQLIRWLQRESRIPPAAWEGITRIVFIIETADSPDVAISPLLSAFDHLNI
ncbi:hypothetical protein DFH06DRAFT_1339092 [Mycena polygramma]|nr:hypothetical protein DFH06DRAFT_1339092 [Mycena polygramma]